MKPANRWGEGAVFVVARVVAVCRHCRNRVGLDDARNWVHLSVNGACGRTRLNDSDVTT